MTEFSDLDEKMLRDMVLLHKSQNLCIYSWLSKLFNDRISFKYLAGNLSSQYKIIIKYDSVSEKELLSKIKYFHFLFDRLENKHLIKLDFFGSANFEFDVIDANEYTLSAYPESILYNFLSMWGYKPILVSNYLIDLVDNKFRTEEQRQFEKQLNKAEKQIKIAWAAFGISLLTLIYTLNNETKIDQSQFNQIKQTIEQTAIPDVIKTQIVNDTLTTRIIEVPKAQQTTKFRR